MKRHPFLSHYQARLGASGARTHQYPVPLSATWGQYACWHYLDTLIVLYPHLPYFSEQGQALHEAYLKPGPDLGSECSLERDELIAKATKEGVPVADRLALIEKWGLPSRHGGWKRGRAQLMVQDVERLRSLPERQLPWRLDPPRDAAAVAIARRRIEKGAQAVALGGVFGVTPGTIRDRTGENLIATHGTKSGPWSAVVIHHAVGSSRSSDGTTPPGESGSVENIAFHLAKRDVGYHFIITRDGVIHQMVPTNKKVWHAGQNRGPSRVMDKPAYLEVVREVVQGSEGGDPGTITEAKRKLIAKRYEAKKVGGYVDPDLLQPWQQNEPYAKLPDGTSPNSNSIGISLAYRTGTALYNIRPGEFRPHPDPYYVNPKYGPRGRWSEIASPQQEDALVKLIAKLQSEGTVGSGIYSHGRSEPGRPDLGVVAQKTDPGWGLNLTRVIERVNALRGVPTPVAKVRSPQPPQPVVVKAGMPALAFVFGGGLAWLAWKAVEEDLR